MDDFDKVMAGAKMSESKPFLPSSGIVEFNPSVYVTTFSDVKEAVDCGRASSALEHYQKTGRQERRLESEQYIQALAGGCSEKPSHGHLSFNVEAVLISTSGVMLVVGWIDDRSSQLLSISAIQGPEGRNTRAIARCRRLDVEQALATGEAHSFGFWLIDELSTFVDVALKVVATPVMLRARLSDGRFSQVEVSPRLVADTELRETALGHFASLEYLGNRDIEAFQQLDRGAGAAIIAFNRRITSVVTLAAHVERFGPQRGLFAASFIVCLYGKSEYFFLQNALFATGRSVDKIEFVYVSNSPELVETLQKEALIAERIYGLNITLVMLPDNAGFSAANNAAARAARSRRLVFINPDVFPRDNDWAVQHAQTLETQPQHATKLFGALLYYDDGSLMHGGMYFEVDRGLSVKACGIDAQPLIRVEHYGKGTPAWSNAYSVTRPVPAVTGAFISVEREWFEHLGGFTEDYVFGHYEDADLCLKSLQKGVPVWLQDVRFWHLEGKGSVRRPVHEGGSLVNRWHFTRNWGDLIETSLAGRNPPQPFLRSASLPDVAVSDSLLRGEKGGLRRLTMRSTKRTRAERQTT